MVDCEVPCSSALSLMDGGIRPAHFLWTSHARKQFVPQARPTSENEERTPGVARLWLCETKLKKTKRYWAKRSHSVSYNTYPYIRESSIRMYTKVDIWHNNIQWIVQSQFTKCLKYWFFVLYIWRQCCSNKQLFSYPLPLVLLFSSSSTELSCKSGWTKCTWLSTINVLYCSRNIPRVGKHEAVQKMQVSQTKEVIIRHYSSTVHKEGASDCTNVSKLRRESCPISHFRRHLRNILNG